jgi:hypothetical protein
VIFFENQPEKMGEQKGKQTKDAIGQDLIPGDGMRAFVKIGKDRHGKTIASPASKLTKQIKLESPWKVPDAHMISDIKTAKI